jgi:nucleotide-binding universal stress UspA family protein
VSPKPDGLIDFLAWHDISAKPVEANETASRVGPAIVDAALNAECDLLVLGAYIHTRAFSLLFGSMTEYVLSNPKMPALLVP